jgi:hypothetical protein
MSIQIDINKIEHDWICRSCGDKYGSWKGGPNAIETFHHNICAYCLKPNQVVCHIRRFGYPENPNIRDTKK